MAEHAVLLIDKRGWFRPGERRHSYAQQQASDTGMTR
jgi:hypothetical protein